MFTLRTLVFPTDGSAAADAARSTAERLARRHRATLHVLRVEVLPPVANVRYGPVPDPTTDDAGVVTAHRQASSADDAIVAYAAEVGAEMIVMGTHGRSGLDRLTLGSTAEGVLRRAPCPVLTVGPRATAAEGPVLAPVAFESTSDAALETAAALAEAEGTGLIALHVIELLYTPVPYAFAAEPFDATLRPRLEATLKRWTAAYADAPVAWQTEVRHGDAATEILAAAEAHGARLIVQASHGRRGVGRWMLGSVAEAVARRAPCPVLTLRMGVPGLSTDAAGPVPRADWAALFDALSARAARAPHTVRVEVRAPETTGVLYADARLLGVTYDHRDDTVQVMVDGGQHHTVRPFSIRSAAGAWALDTARDAEAPGPWTLDVVGADGVHEQITVQRAAG